MWKKRLSSLLCAGSEKGDVVRSVLNRLFELLLIASDYIKPFRRHSFKFGYFAKDFFFNLQTCIFFQRDYSWRYT